MSSPPAPTTHSGSAPSRRPSDEAAISGTHLVWGSGPPPVTRNGREGSVAEGADRQHQNDHQPGGDGEGDRDSLRHRATAPP